MFRNKIVLFLAVLFTACTFFVCFLYTSTFQVNLTVFNSNKHSITKGKKEFLLVPKANCDEDPPFLLYLVTATHHQTKERDAIRRTWGRDQRIAGKRTVAYFLLGYDPVYQSTILNESHYYGDIIQKNFTDSYDNLTLKVLMGIKWVHELCPLVTFVMKTDSDMFVNTYYLTELLLGKNQDLLYTGHVKLKEGPIRDPMSKWFMATEDYPNSTYPPFCSGTGYLFSGALAGKIIAVSKHIPILRLEDVYIGLCLAELNVTPVELDSSRTFYDFKVKFNICRFQKLVTSHGVSPQEILVYWKVLGELGEEECEEKESKEFQWT
ncbi:beta-1,3-galactosyltransferase 5-like isoform X2 [Hypanus sabinus]|nr:beta-1,3-galactosyltransferase 5-like isoform X2 [Hypanus sabinus]XP_059824757.1 beta-1,3-galactosyltransferase 5-like isoform X2 [Hypanus sabinus]